MKIIFYTIFIISLNSCHSQKKINTEESLKKTEQKCPEDGTCTFEVLKNKSFKISSKFGNTYPVFSPNNNKSILKFEYTRNLIPDTEDSSYKELIYIEISNDLKTPLDIKNIDLTKTKASFGRLCFCRGQTGYYKIKQGDLSIKKNGQNNYNLKFKFKITEVPQVITTIEEHFNL